MTEIEPKRVVFANFTALDKNDLKLFVVVDGKTVELVMSRTAAVSAGGRLFQALLG